MKQFFAALALFQSLGLYSQSVKLETVVQKGHNASVKAVAVSPDGKYIATGSRDKSAKVWDISSGRELRSFLGHQLTVNGVEFSPDGRLLATSSADNTAKVWEVVTGKELFSTPPDKKYITDVAFSPNGEYMVCAGYGDSAQVWSVSSKNLYKKIAVNADQGSGYGTSIAFSPDGSWLAFGEDNKTVNVYNAKTFELVYTFKPEQGWCGGCGTIVTFSPDSKTLAKLAHDSNVETYDLTTGKLIKTYGDQFDQIAGLSFSPDRKTIMAAGDKQVFQWDIQTGTLKLKFTAVEKDDINEAVYSVDGKLIITANDDNTATGWQAVDGAKAIVFTGVLNSTEKGVIEYDPNNFRESYIAKYLRLKNTILLSPDGKGILKGKSGTKAKLWDISGGEPYVEYIAHEKAVFCYDYSKDGKYLVTGDGAGKAILWDVKTGKKLMDFDGHRDPLFDVKVSPDGGTLLTSSWDGAIIVWDVKTGKKLTVLDLTNSSSFSTTYTPNGLYLVTGRLGKTLDLWEPDSKTIVRTFVGHTDAVSSISFSPVDKNLMLTSSWDGTIRIWDITTGLMVKKFKVFQGGINAAIYSPDGKYVISGGDDRLIRIWDVNSSKVVKTLEGHQAEVSSLAISNDGKYLVSLSLDDVIKIWNLDKGKEFYEHIHIGENDWMAKNMDGYFNATPGARDAIHFVKGMESFGADQFFEKFYRPDLLNNLFKDRGADNGMLRMDDVLKSSPPPLVKLAVLPIQGKNEAELFVKITDAGGGVDELKIMQNGKSIPLTNPRFPSKKGESTIYTDTIPMVGGINTFSASAFSKARVESPVSEAKLFSDNTDKASICHLFVIGIDRYKNPSLTLNFAREDAESFAQLIKDKSESIFSHVKVHALYDADATKKNILDTLNKLETQINQNDVFLFFYAGHGSLVDNRFFFITTECTRLYDLNNLSKEGLEAAILQDKLKNIKALKQVIIMDACQSGGSVELLAERGSLEEKAIAQLSRSAGIHVLASAGSEQNAKELKDLKHGLFTYVLLQALSGKADGAPHDGKITIYELKSYLDDQVPALNQQYSGKAQYPYTFSRGHDFPLVLE